MRIAECGVRNGGTEFRSQKVNNMNPTPIPFQGISYLCHGPGDFQVAFKIWPAVTFCEIGSRKAAMAVITSTKF